MRFYSLIISLSIFCACEPSKWLEITPVTEAALALEAPCDAPVQGTQGIDIELDYLPHVVKCENGAASYEALKAQAVSARSYLYYKIARNGSIADGTSDQVYSCGREPSQIHYDAVADTAGIHLVYEETLVCTFYVAGAHPSDEISCIATADDPEDFNTEHYVTYNWGYTGNSVQQTHLGWIDDDNLANRGCMSQNGSDCLADQGWGYEDILRFYYGADISFAVAEGECLEDIPCEEDPECIEDETTNDGGGAATHADEGPANTTNLISVAIPHRHHILTLNNGNTSSNVSEKAQKALAPSVVSSCLTAPSLGSMGLFAFLWWRRKKAKRSVG